MHINHKLIYTSYEPYSLMGKLMHFRCTHAGATIYQRGQVRSLPLMEQLLVLKGVGLGTWEALAVEARTTAGAVAPSNA